MLCINVTLYSNSFFNEIKNLLDSHKTTGLEHYRFNDELSLNLKKEFKILSKATKDNNSKLRDSTLYNIINIYIASGTYDKAKKYALELQKAGIYEKNDETTGTAKYLLGTIYNNISKYDLALKNYTDAYRYLKHNQALLAALYISIGNVYRHLNNFKSALGYINAAEDIADKLNNKSLKASALFYISVIYLNQKKYDKAFAKITECSELSSQVGTDSFDMKAINIIQGRILYYQNKYDSALTLFTKILNKSNESNYFSFIATLYIGKIYTQQKRYKKALEYLKLTKIYNKKMGNIEIHSRDLYHALAELYYAEGNYKIAYQYHTEYDKAKSRLLNSVILSNAALLSSKYKNIQISMLKENILIKNQRINYTNSMNLLLIIIVSLILILLILFTILYLNKKRFAVKLNELNVDLDELVKLKTEKLIQTVNKLQKEIRERKELQLVIREVSEREQQKVAHDLHDNLGQTLVGVSFQAKALSDRIKKTENEELLKSSEELIKNISLASNQIRELSRVLSNIELKNDGLVLSLKKFKTYILKQFCISCTLIVDPKVAVSLESLNLQAKTNLYRIVQESVNNSLKHGKAKNIAITLSYGKILIKDDGVGYMTNITANGIGLKIMKCRADYLKGKLMINSAINKGTTITCSFPVKKNST